MTSGSTGPLGALPGAPVGRLLERVSRDAFPFDEPDTTTPYTTAGFTARALSADKQAVGEGRRFTGTILNRWALSPLVDNAALIVSELLSNALRYGLGGFPAWSSPSQAVWLGLMRREGTVLFAVCDHSARVPQVKEPDQLAQSGRGLHIVDCLSDTWGWTTPDTDGKAVWAAVSCRRESEGAPVSPRHAQGAGRLR